MKCRLCEYEIKDNMVGGVCYPCVEKLVKAELKARSRAEKPPAVESEEPPAGEPAADKGKSKK